MIVTTKATSTRSSSTRRLSVITPLRETDRAAFSCAARSRVFRCSRALGEVVADVSKDVLDLTAQEDHRDDHGNGDDGDDECVFHEALPALVAHEARHDPSSFRSGPAQWSSATTAAARPSIVEMTPSMYRTTGGTTVGRAPVS